MDNYTIHKAGTIDDCKHYVNESGVTLIEYLKTHNCAYLIVYIREDGYVDIQEDIDGPTISKCFMNIDKLIEHHRNEIEYLNKIREE